MKFKKHLYERASKMMDSKHWWKKMRPYGLRIFIGYGDFIGSSKGREVSANITSKSVERFKVKQGIKKELYEKEE